MVKKILTPIIFVLLSTVLLLPAEAGGIENPETPPAKNAGRLAKITEILRITDEGGQFYFKTPSRLLVAPDGCVFVSDEKQFLKFDKQGKFIANLQRPGEGPGEYVYINNFQVIGDRLIVNAFQPHKMVICDLSGKLIKETRLNSQPGLKRVVGIFADKYYYFQGALVFNEIKGGMQVLNMNLYVSTFDDKVTDLKLKLPQRQFSEKIVSKDGNVMVRIMIMDNFSSALENEHSLYASNTAEYMIKLIDLATGKITGQFTRKYKSVPYVEPEPEDNSRTLKGFTKEFFSDITGIALYKDKIWVFTSTVDKKKGVLVDLFGKDGKYLDNVYLPLPQLERPDTLERRSFTIVDDFLYIMEPDEEETPTIVKYKIEI